MQGSATQGSERQRVSDSFVASQRIHMHDTRRGLRLSERSIFPGARARTPLTNSGWKLFILLGLWHKSDGKLLSGLRLATDPSPERVYRPPCTDCGSNSSLCVTSACSLLSDSTIPDRRY